MGDVKDWGRLAEGNLLWSENIARESTEDAIRRYTLGAIEVFLGGRRSSHYQETRTLRNKVELFGKLIENQTEPEMDTYVE